MHNQHKDQYKQCAHHPFADLFQTALQAAPADDKARQRDDDHPENHLDRVREHLAKDACGLLGGQAVKAAGQEAEEVVDHPAGDGGVVHHQQHTARHAEPAVDMPLTALRLQRLVRGACCAAARPADCQLHRQHRQPHKHQKKQVEQHKDTAAALARDGGKPPDIADADRAAGADKDEAKARAEALSLFLGFHTIPLFSQSSIIIAYHGEACKR